MVIAICGSMSFAKEMVRAKRELEKQRHIVFVPVEAEIYGAGTRKRNPDKDAGALRKREFDFIRQHAKLIDVSQAILVINCNKKEEKNYIGGNTLIEIGYAHIMHKQIFLLQDIPNDPKFRQEVVAMDPIIIHGNFDIIPI